MRWMEAENAFGSLLAMLCRGVKRRCMKALHLPLAVKVRLWGGRAWRFCSRCRQWWLSLLGRMGSRGLGTCQFGRLIVISLFFSYIDLYIKPTTYPVSPSCTFSYILLSDPFFIYFLIYWLYFVPPFLDSKDSKAGVRVHCMRFGASGWLLLSPRKTHGMRWTDTWM